MTDFLLEIGLEEVPARMIAGAEAELGRRVNDLLARERLLGAAARLTTYSTPRRLAVLVEDVLASQADTEEKLTGPSWKVAFKDGAPTAAAHAFARKAGVAVEALEKVVNPKGEYVGATVKRLGRAAAKLLAAELPKEVLSLYWAKNMYWRAGKPERFVRPVRWVVALLDSSVVPLEIAGIAAGNTSRGHRVLHGEVPVVLAKATDYVESLRKAFVVADVAERRQSIRKALDAATRAVAGARWREDAALIETVVHLTEWPTVVLGGFEPEYLALPEEVLVTVMRDHQKYFAVEGADGKLAPHFLAVLNTQVDEEGAAIIRHGNARVLRARFKDAQFFWDFDQKTPLTERVESLKNVTFQKELGSYYWKTEQNLAVAQALAAVVKAAGVAFDEAALLKAVELAKTDLTTELVKEFTELQGEIGGLYARAQELGDAAAQAIYDQYKPASIDDAIPTTIEGQLLGLADRIQTITEMFAIGNAPTGSKDPFALRRAANAVVKILAESQLPLTVLALLTSTGRSSEEVAEFMRERLSFYLRDVRGFGYDVVNAVLAKDLRNVYGLLRVDDIRDVIARVESLNDERGSADFLAVSSAFKRIKNIIRQAQTRGEESREPEQFTELLVEPEGMRLLEEADLLVIELRGLIENRRYREALRLVGALRPSVDAFFDKPVVVLHDDPKLRAARLALVRRVFFSLAGIADFSEIVTG
ncbi:MAG: glycine--tRNA ligase subunit beta [Terracidiphilus sp.]|jgi:glycyl-tRNA synthetase beta chain